MSDQSSHRRVIVVLGMHRSGTSAITRSLELLGVRLGDNLHPASTDNPKGFWEDRDVLRLNEQLLAALGSSYDGLGLVLDDIPETAAISALRVHARELVAARCVAGAAVWGFKDPRTARLLPFWQAVFGELGCETGYLIAARNPISIVESLRKRDGFDPEKTFYLWLEHLVPAINRTQGAPRVVVDYDRLLNQPDVEIARIARTLGLAAPEPAALAAYKTEFLEGGLRHSVASAQDLAAHPAVPRPVLVTQDWLDRLASDAVGSDAPELVVAFQSLAQDLHDLLPALRLMARLDQRLKAEKAATDQAHTVAAALEEQRSANVWLVSQRDAWEQRTKEVEAAYQEQIKGSAWLAAQRDAWEQQSKSHEDRIRQLESDYAEQEKAKDWLASQRDAWERSAREAEAEIQQAHAQAQARLQETSLCAIERDEWKRKAERYEELLGRIRRSWLMRLADFLGGGRLL